MTHVCRYGGSGHAIPPEEPERLEGPKIGQFCIYRQGTPKESVVRVIERSYVWSPGECNSKGGYRHYDWSVVEEGPDEYRAVVVNDSDLIPILTDRVVAVYQRVVGL